MPDPETFLSGRSRFARPRPMVRLCCAACGAALTLPVEWAGFSAYDIGVADGQSPVPRGHIIQWRDAQVTPVFYGDGRPDGLHVWSRAGAVSVHPDDVIRETLERCGTDNGCCGSDGSDGDNRACRCGAVLGTQWSDCWTQAEVRLRGDAIRPEPA